MIPTSAGVTLRPEFGASFQEFMELPEAWSFVGLKAAPAMQVAKQSGTFGKVEIAEMLKNQSMDRGANGAYSRSDTKFTTDTYSTREMGGEERVDHRDAAMFADYGQAEALAAQRLRRRLASVMETEITALLDSTATFADAAAAAAWSTQASADPLEDIVEAQQAVLAASGQFPDTMILTLTKLLDLIQVDAVVERLKYWGGQDPSARNMMKNLDILAAALNLKQIFVAGAYRNSADEGQAVTLAKHWTDANVMICKVAQTNDIREPCVARTFFWTGDGAPMNGEVLMESYDEPQTRSTILRVRAEIGPKIMYPETGYIITGC